MTNVLRLQQLSKLLDITRLQDNDTEQGFNQWLQSVPSFTPAAYCVYSEFLASLQQWPGRALQAEIATVVNFPAANLAADVVCEQILQTKMAGATEIDCVMPYKALLRGEHGLVKSFLYDIRQACDNTCLKVIIESGELVTAQQVTKATELAIEGGADFVKTSTGKVATGVTNEAARIILTVIAAANRPVGFKASGGVRSISQALELVQLYEDITGQIATNSGMRIGASTLASDLAEYLVSQ